MVSPRYVAAAVPMRTMRAGAPNPLKTFNKPIDPDELASNPKARPELAECVRNVANFSQIEANLKYDSPTFNPRRFLELLPQTSPKLVALLTKIRELDEHDLREHGTLFKHCIYVDNKTAFYGAKIVAAALLASGYRPLYDKRFVAESGGAAAGSAGSAAFMLLCSSTLYGKPIPVRFRKQILGIFNQRPENIHGALCRFVIVDQGFREGIDLYDTKYCHLFEELETITNERQAIGRNTRFCGQRGLEFHRTKGWPLQVFRYTVDIPDPLRPAYEANRLFEIFLRNSGINLQKMLFASTLEQVAAYGAVDYELTRAVHNFSIRESDSQISEGLRTLLGILTGGARRRHRAAAAARPIIRKSTTPRSRTARAGTPPRHRMKFFELRDYIRANFKEDTWPQAKMENLCVAPAAPPTPAAAPSSASAAPPSTSRSSNARPSTTTTSTASASASEAAAYLDKTTPINDTDEYFSVQTAVLSKLASGPVSSASSAYISAQSASLPKVFGKSAPAAPAVPAPGSLPAPPQPRPLTVGGQAVPQLLEYTPTQNFIRHYFQPESAYKGLLLYHSVGTGKCHAVDTPILMYDGSIRRVQDVRVGDKLMGDDSTPRTVLSLARGRDQMYEIRGEDVSYTVNSEHILCLKRPEAPAEILEITVENYLRALAGGAADAADWKGYRVAVDFPAAAAGAAAAPAQAAAAYTLGVELGHAAQPESMGLWPSLEIPAIYKYANRQVRRAIIEGLADSPIAQPTTIAGSGVEFRLAADKLAADILFVARSVGLRAYRVSDTILEVYLPAIAADVVPYDIAVHPVGPGDYYGFILDGNHRYVLGDFTATHNTCSAIGVATTAFEPAGYTILWITRHTLKAEIWKNVFQRVCSEDIKRRVLDGSLKLPDDITSPLKYLSKSWMNPISYKQFTNMLLGKNDIYQELVRRNGRQDPLRRTLLIIDEAHKLFDPSLPKLERPDTAVLRQRIQDSYALSGRDSCRLLLMTATPYTTDPMQFIQLLNLMRESNAQLPEDFEAFSAKYLDDSSRFTEKTTTDFLDEISGYVSYINREKDARCFAYPVFHTVIVPLSTNRRAEWESQRRALERELFAATAAIEEGEATRKQVRVRVKEDKARLEAQCRLNTTAAQRAACKKEIVRQMAELETTLLSEVDGPLNERREQVKTLGAEMKAIEKKLKANPDDYSQQTALEERCKMPVVKYAARPAAPAPSPATPASQPSWVGEKTTPLPTAPSSIKESSISKSGFTSTAPMTPGTPSEIVVSPVSAPEPPAAPASSPAEAPAAPAAPAAPRIRTYAERHAKGARRLPAFAPSNPSLE